MCAEEKAKALAYLVPVEAPITGGSSGSGTGSAVAGAIALIAQVNPHEHDEILLWGSVPRTGGTQWTRIKAFKGKRTQELIQSRVRVFKKIWASFAHVAELVLSLNGTVAIDWPRACTYWTFPCVKSFCKKYDFKFSDFDGCQYGLTSISERTRGNPIKTMEGSMHET
jgi:hypothetical protein